MFRRLKLIFKRYFITGLFILIPFLMALFFMVFLVNKVDELIIPAAVRHSIRDVVGFPVPGLGLIVVIIVSLATGAVARNFIGNKIIAWNEKLVTNVPLGGSIYQAAKQVIAAIRLKESRAFSRVVLIEYPRKGIYSMAFVTGEAHPHFQSKVGNGLISVFLPTTPNPTSGFFLMLPESETIPIELSVSEAFRLIVSAGIVAKEK